jgi:hypothetical protein
MAEFRIVMKCMWSKDGKFKKFGSKLTKKKDTPKSQKSQEEADDVDMKDGNENVPISVEVDIESDRK